MNSRRHPPSADFFRRLFAAGATALVLALTVFAASPVLHNWLHSHDGQVGDDGCAVAMFAGGVSVPQGSVALTPPSTAWREIPRVVAVEISLVSPRYLRQPERGPPVG